MAVLKGSVIFLLVLINLIDATVVKTSLGKVAGVKVKSILKDESYYAFMGIPYGKPKERFLAPEPHEGWTETLQAKKERKPCAQMNLPIRNIQNYGFSGEDDCLNLSIYTPKVPKDATENISMPVIVFLYNEHFKVTHNSSKDYGPDFIVKEDVVLVTINHRIGSMGFLSFEDEVLPGNNGLRDILLGLKFLHQNIHLFGGDPYKITMMGVDGGAAAIEILARSPKGKGLFSGAILQSGTAYNSAFIKLKPKEQAKLLAKHLERGALTSEYLLGELKYIDTIEIVTGELLSVDADEGRHAQMANVPFGPSVEPEHPDAIMTSLPEDTLAELDIPIMIGYNSRESIEMCERYLEKPEYLTFADRDFLMVLPIRTGFRFNMQSNVYRHAVDEIKNFYFDEGYVKISKPGEYLTYLADVMTVYPIDYAVRKYLNESKSDVYYYMFDFSGELNARKQYILKEAKTMEGTWGANTGDELCYLFVCKSIRKNYLKVLEDEDSEELKVIRNMVKMWTNFAKTGNPTPAGSDFKWTPATKEKKDILVISDELQMRTNLHEDGFKFWDNFFVKYKEMAKDGVVTDEKDEL